MNLKKLVSLQSAIWGLTSSLFFCLGTIIQSDENAELLSKTYAGGNTYLLKTLLTQRLDFTIGATLLAFAFVSQFFVIVKDDQPSKLKLNSKMGWGIIGCVSFITLLIALGFRLLCM